MILQNYQQFGGIHPEFAALQNLLAYQGVVHPAGDQPLSEALLFGMGAGVGASYFHFAYKGYPPTLSLNMIGRYKAGYGELLVRVCQHLGLEPALKQPKSEKAALTIIRNGLTNGRPVIVETAGWQLPYPMQRYEAFAEQALVVYGLDEAADTVYLAGRASQPLQMPLSELLAAWKAYGPLKHLSLSVAPAAKLTAVALQTAVAAGLHQTVEGMINPPTPKRSFGLNALQKWAELVGNRQSAKGWLQAFAPGADLYYALASVYAQIELVGTVGGGLRGLYANFLLEAADWLGKPALRGVAESYGQLARLWTALAEAALPNQVPMLAETKRLMRQKHDLFLAGATAVAPQIAHVQQQQTELATAVAADFPLDPAAGQLLLSSLSAQIKQLYEAEKLAITTLQALQ